MTTIVLETLEKRAISFIQKLDTAVRIVKTSGDIITGTVKLYFVLIGVIFVCEKTRRDFRKAVELCSKECEKDPQECAQFFCENSIKIRDHFVYLCNKSKTLSYLLPFRRYFDKAAFEWDDFVEDCTIATDPEIKKLIGQIANAA